jgi:hypothetical protein
VIEAQFSKRAGVAQAAPALPFNLSHRKGIAEMKSSIRWWQLLRLLRLWYLQAEVSNIDYHIAEEQRRHDDFERRMRSWRAYRAEKVGRAHSLAHGRGSVSYAGMARGRQA